MNLRYLRLYHNYDIMIYIIKSINWCNNLSDNEIAMLAISNFFSSFENIEYQQNFKWTKWSQERYKK